MVTRNRLIKWMSLLVAGVVLCIVILVVKLKAMSDRGVSELLPAEVLHSKRLRVQVAIKLISIVLDAGVQNEASVVSNLQQIPLIVSLIGEPSVGSAGTGSDSLDGAVGLIVRDSVTHKEVRTLVTRTGVERNRDVTKIHLTLEIPVDPSTMEMEIQDRLAIAKKEEEASVSRKPGELTRSIVDDRFSELQKALRSLYHANEPGTYEVLAYYQFTVPDAGSAPIRSNPLRIEVRNDGRYLNQPVFH
jgi:hypothetical protein